MKRTTLYLIALLFAGTAALKTTAADIFVARIPDLRIAHIAENGFRAWVRVENIGTGNSGPCSLRVWHLNNGAWYVSGTVPVNGVPAGGSVWVLVQAGGVAAAFNAYKVDAFNQVAELKEVNNLVYIPYGPAG